MRRIAEAFGVDAIECGGTSFDAVYAAASELIRRLRDGVGPALVKRKSSGSILIPIPTTKENIE